MNSEVPRDMLSGTSPNVASPTSRYALPPFILNPSTASASSTVGSAFSSDDSCYGCLHRSSSSAALSLSLFSHSAGDLMTPSVTEKPNPDLAHEEAFTREISPSSHLSLFF